MFKIYKFDDTDEAVCRMNGGIMGSVPAGGLALVGKTIKFAVPTFNHTFVAGSGTNPDILSSAEVKSQLETASGGDLTVTFNGPKMYMTETIPTTGVALDAAAATANKPLGLYSSMVGVRTYHHTSSVFPRIERVDMRPPITVLVWEE